jgi:hypothetical protein
LTIISQCWKNTSQLLALLAKFFGEKLAFGIDLDFKAATSTLLGHSLAQALQLTHNSNVIQFLMIEFIVFL